MLEGGCKGHPEMASRLQRLIGWRRLWLVATAALAIWFVVMWPLQSLKDWQLGEYSFDRAIEKEFASRRCQTYQMAPFEQLQDPRDGEGCWHIYTSRKYHDTVPYTLEAHKSETGPQESRNYDLTALSMGTAGTAIVSGLVYFLGWLVGWVLTGFRSIERTSMTPYPQKITFGEMSTSGMDISDLSVGRVF